MCHHTVDKELEVTICDFASNYCLCTTISVVSFQSWLVIHVC